MHLGVRQVLLRNRKACFSLCELRLRPKKLCCGRLAAELRLFRRINGHCAGLDEPLHPREVVPRLPVSRLRLRERRRCEAYVVLCGAYGIFKIDAVNIEERSACLDGIALLCQQCVYHAWDARSHGG